jgi:hypothetical protein
MSVTFDRAYAVAYGTEEQAMLEAVSTTLRGIYKATLSAAAESGNSITVTGQLYDLFGNAATATRAVSISTVALTADKGDVEITDGTGELESIPATGDNNAYVLADSDGTFAFTVADDQAESVLVTVVPNNGIASVILLTFA